jgi:hypothetical protein
MGKDTIKVLEKLEQIEETINQLEEDNGGRLIRKDELTQLFPELARWLNAIIARFDKAALIFYHKEDKRVVIKLFTEIHSYHIVARRRNKKERGEGDLGYLGCTASTRKPRVGESWTRGRDLADGIYSEQTWINILCDIVGHEMKPLDIDIEI